MSRTKGAKNVSAFDSVETIATTASAEVKHLAKTAGATPLEEFNSLVNHEHHYLQWLSSRHLQLQEAKKKLSSGNRGPKDATYRKYRWYAEQQTLFETINSFEVFYKRTFINLATALRNYIPADRVTGSVDAKILWSMRGKASVPALIFEHQLYHDLERVDRASQMLIEARRYCPGQPSSGMKAKVSALQAIFQIRHTLAHNQGLVTVSDRAKFGFNGYAASAREIIDPTKDHLGESIRRFLKEEAAEYTEWVLIEAARYLEKVSEKDDVTLATPTYERIRKTLGSVAALDALPWA